MTGSLVRCLRLCTGSTPPARGPLRPGRYGDSLCAAGIDALEPAGRQGRPGLVRAGGCSCGTIGRARLPWGRGQHAAEPRQRAAALLLMHYRFPGSVVASATALKPVSAPAALQDLGPRLARGATGDFGGLSIGIPASVPDPRCVCIIASDVGGDYGVVSGFPRIPAGRDPAPPVVRGRMGVVKRGASGASAACGARSRACVQRVARIAVRRHRETRRSGGAPVWRRGAGALALASRTAGQRAVAGRVGGRTGPGRVMVGVVGFEPTASRPQTARSAGLSYTPRSRDRTLRGIARLVHDGDIAGADAVRG